MENKTVSEYLEECGLVDKVLDGIDKISDVENYKQTAMNSVCSWKMGLIKKSTRVAGQCCHTERKIKLHIKLLKAGREGDRNDTLLHELGHMLVKIFWPREKAHGKAWKYVTSMIGGVPERCHDYSYFKDLKIAKANHKYICKDCGYEHFSQKALKNMDRRYHTGCSRKSNGGQFTHITL